MPLRKFKRNGTWYIRGSVRGERVYQSARTADAAQAEEARARLEARLWDRRVGGLRGTTSFAEAVIAYAGARAPAGTWAEALDTLSGWFGAWRLAEIDQAALERFMDASPHFGHVRRRGAGWEVELAVGIETRALLAELNGLAVPLAHFEHLQPTLHDIFVAHVATAHRPSRRPEAVHA